MWSVCNRLHLHIVAVPIIFSKWIHKEILSVDYLNTYDQDVEEKE